jgi:hypothetical protein
MTLNIIVWLMLPKLPPYQRFYQLTHDAFDGIFSTCGGRVIDDCAIQLIVPKTELDQILTLANWPKPVGFSYTIGLGIQSPVSHLSRMSIFRSSFILSRQDNAVKVVKNRFGVFNEITGFCLEEAGEFFCRMINAPG